MLQPSRATRVLFCSIDSLSSSTFSHLSLHLELPLLILSLLFQPHYSPPRRNRQPKFSNKTGTKKGHPALEERHTAAENPRGIDFSDRSSDHPAPVVCSCLLYITNILRVNRFFLNFFIFLKYFPVSHGRGEREKGGTTAPPFITPFCILRLQCAAVTCRAPAAPLPPRAPP